MSIRSKALYLRKVPAIVGVKIRQFDMVKAGMSVMRTYQLAPVEEIDRLERLSKHQNNIAIGKKRRNDREFSAQLSRYVRQSVSEFLSINDVPDEAIIAIKNDAVFITGDTEIKTVLDNGIQFRLDGSYTSFFYLGQIEFYFSSETGKVVIKGFKHSGDEDSLLFISFLAEAFSMFEAGNKELLASQLQLFRRQYLDRELPLGYYKTLDRYKGHPSPIGDRVYTVQSVSEDSRSHLDISSNLLNFIIPLIQLLVQDNS